MNYKQKSAMWDRLMSADVIYGDNEPHGWIQWKGTDVCMDVHCQCGVSTHVDAEFAYFIQCGKCGAKYAVGQNVKLTPLTAEEAVGVAERLIVTDVDAEDL